MNATSLYWQLPLFVAILWICAETFLFDASVPEYFREIHLPEISTLLSFAAITGGLFLIGWMAQIKATLTWFGGGSVAALLVALFMMIWMVPAELKSLSEEEKPRSDASNGQVSLDSDEEKRRREKIKLHQHHRTVAGRALYSAIVLLLPVVLLMHVQRNHEFYFSNLKDYKTQQQKNLPPGRQQGSVLPDTPLEQYIEAIDLHFVNTPKLQCGQNDAECASVRSIIEFVQNNRSLLILKIFYYFIFFYLILRYCGKVAQIHFHYRPKDPDSLGLQNDVIKQCSAIISISSAFMAALIVAGVDFTSLGLFGGLIGAGLSVAMKDLLGNVVAGILLLWDKTIKKDDVITVSPSSSADTGSTYAIVKKMTMRYTVVEDRNDVRRLIPNSFLTNNVVENWTHEDKKVRLRVVVGVDYNTDLRLARTILEAVCYEVPRIETRVNPPKAVVTGFGENSINLALRFYIQDAEKGIRPVISDLYIGIRERFKKENITIPYPRRDISFVPSPDTDLFAEGRTGLLETISSGDQGNDKTERTKSGRSRGKRLQPRPAVRTMSGVTRLGD